MNILANLGDDDHTPKHILEYVSRCTAGSIYTVERLLSMNDSIICESTGLLPPDVTELKHFVANIISCTPVSALELAKYEAETTFTLTTGSAKLDALLENGILTREFIEIVGSTATGKTQLCMSICSSLLKDSDVSVVYVDTTNSFCATRFTEIIGLGAEGQETTQPKLRDRMGNLACAKVFNALDLIQLLEDLKVQCQTADSATKPLRLLVIDSITPIISTILGGRIGNELNHQGHVVMATISRQLKTIAVTMGVAIVVVNSTVRADFIHELKPALGKSWSYEPSIQLLLRPNPNDASIAVTTTKSDRFEAGRQTSFTIGKFGIC